MSRLFGPMRQIGIVVRDIDKAMRHWVEVCGVGPWFYAEQLPMDEFRYRGRPYDLKVSIALANSGDTQLELIQPLTGYSIYDEHLERRGEGLHHIKLYYADCAKAVRDYASRGYPVLQCGKIDDDEHYYLDTENDFGYIVELGNAGRIRPAERRYPE